MKLKRLISSLIVLLASTSLVIGGGVAIYFGAKNISVIYQLVYSPIDRATSPDGGNRGDFLSPEQAADFIPVLTLPDEVQGERQAPDIPSNANQAEGEAEAQDTLAQKIPPQVPERVVIGKLAVDAMVVPVTEHQVEYLGEEYLQWKAPATGALGWHSTSALLGSSGNTVINGHSSGYGETFKDLAELENGDIIDVYAGDYRYSYAVANVMILKERWEPIEIRMENAQWINPSDDERLTLISCWPNNSSTHRLIVVAVPLHAEQIVHIAAESSEGLGDPLLEVMD